MEIGDFCNLAGEAKHFGRREGLPRCETLHWKARLARRFRDVENVFVRNFDPECLLPAALRKTFLDEDGRPCIRNKDAHGGEARVAGAVVGFDTLADDGRVAIHAVA